ncbi:hypothetical protein PRI8871_02813 [Pseudoprimorskyibacter insulae]|uniref:Uncharacterized protein n=1 Tax=Pseudoprimorskyibacter insulae TaxID=1695997 RepID=A0A2R8AYB0_9RHOB|nr:hypothetical protein PRI8871_02813 [Pseudoprimorskyibacter insulae]
MVTDYRGNFVITALVYNEILLEDLNAVKTRLRNGGKFLAQCA